MLIRTPYRPLTYRKGTVPPILWVNIPPTNRRTYKHPPLHSYLTTTKMSLNSTSYIMRILIITLLLLHLWLLVTSSPFSAEGATYLLKVTSPVTGQDILVSGRLQCQTTHGSPRAADARTNAHKLEAVGQDRCEQKISAGSNCTIMANSGSAIIALCGEHMDWIGCWEAAYAGRIIQERCERFGLSGGTVWPRYGSTLRVVVYAK